jgi:hypothetical protein
MLNYRKIYLWHETRVPLTHFYRLTTHFSVYLIFIIIAFLGILSQSIYYFLVIITSTLCHSYSYNNCVCVCVCRLVRTKLTTLKNQPLKNLVKLLNHPQELLTGLWSYRTFHYLQPEVTLQVSYFIKTLTPCFTAVITIDNNVHKYEYT